MRKLAYTTMLFCLWGLKSEAQQSTALSTYSKEPIGFGIYLAPGLTTTLGNKFVLAGGIEVQKKISKSFTGFARAGVIRVKNPMYGNIILPEIVGEGYEKNMVFIPVKAGLRYFPIGRFYLEGEAGVAFDTQGGSSFIWSPGIGIALPGGVDLAFKYENVPNHMALHLTYHFGARK